MNINMVRSGVYVRLISDMKQMNLLAWDQNTAFLIDELTKIPEIEPDQTVSCKIQRILLILTMFSSIQGISPAGGLLMV